jgi:serine/threonine-protein kinase
MSSRKLLARIQFVLFLLILFFLSAILSSRAIQRGELVSVPDLAGKTFAEAKSELGRKKLSLQEKAVEYSDRFERGQIISQEPSAGSKIRVNKAVRVVLSGGSELIDIPPLVGRSLEAAAKLLSVIGLQRGKVSQIHTSRYAAGRIIAQEPAPSGEKVKRMTPLNFLVSQGEVEPKYVMPDLIEKNAGAAIAQLKKLGFRVADLRYSYYPGRDPGIIIKQFPPHGYAVARRNLITLEVSR